jgi:CheY-like chemotaxis protein
MKNRHAAELRAMILRILAIDDEPAVLEVFKAFAEPLGCEVITVSDGLEALRYIADERFDGIFVDINMPLVDGFEVTRHVRASKINGHVPVVMVTGLDTGQNMRRGFEAGVSFFMGKPFSRARVMRLINASRGAMMRERRRHVRVAFRTRVIWAVDKQTYHFTSMDVGEGGMILQPSHGLRLGTEMAMQFSPPSERKMCHASGTIIRRGGGDSIVVQFTHIPEGALRAIQQYIAAVLSEESTA